MNEGFALTTYSGYHGIKDTKDWETDPDFWRNIFLAAQEKGIDDLRLIEKLSGLLEPKYNSSQDENEFEEYRQGHRSTIEIVKEVGADRPTDAFISHKKNGWQNYQYRVYEITKKRLESAGGLKLKTAEEVWADFA
jgi:hypothetical protein